MSSGHFSPIPKIERHFFLIFDFDILRQHYYLNSVHCTIIAMQSVGQWVIFNQSAKSAQ